MSGFSAEWLALRESVDHESRSTALTRLVADALAGDQSPAILDLACGAGSNFRYLSPAIPHGRWLLVDHDADLLARIPPAPDVDTCCLDLSALDDRSIFDGRALVTASALLDLVSDRWLHALAERCADAQAAVLFALNYDGRIICTPEDSDDGMIVALVNQHQRTDKGFGSATGPDAADRASHWFGQHGYQIRRAPSDWALTPASSELQRQLIDGWTQAASEIAPEQTRVIDRWRERRLAHLAAGWSHIVVGHEDVAGTIEAEDLRI
jgi:hypothetical protein